jgi:MOSC domain-containing protein YiiM
MQPDPRWTAQDLTGTVRTVEPWWELLVAGIDPLPTALGAARRRIDELASAAAAGSGASLPERSAAGTALVRALSEAGRLAHGCGVGPPHHVGLVAGLHASPGGVPKAAVPLAEIGWRGLAGDRQATRRHHGRLWQAVCLWSAEVIDGLAAEGHPIFPGAAGENVTVAGVEWAALRPGSRLRLGESVVEITVPALPCVNNAPWFLGGDFRRMDHRRHPGHSRFYALVSRPGGVRVGDDVVVE